MDLYLDLFLEFLGEFSVGVHTDAELKSMVGRMEFENFETVDLTDNDLAKDHLRHLVKPLRLVF